MTDILINGGTKTLKFPVEFSEFKNLVKDMDIDIYNWLQEYSFSEGTQIESINILGNRIRVLNGQMEEGFIIKINILGITGDDITIEKFINQKLEFRKYADKRFMYVKSN